ncbi:MAG TPA: CxxC-x17-CxxC domain-containing protein [Nitrosopumilaceae archaeon]|nr:CxxC-x17-CxxC domain-containing protein [Nitrosopumilaceae archaeon]
MSEIMSYERKMYPCTCSDCGKDSTVPFEPKQGKPVYCQECFPKHRSQGFQKRF